MLPKTCPVCKQKPLVADQGYLICGHCKFYKTPLNWWQRIIVWPRGKIGWWRLPILAWFFYVFQQNLRHDDFALNRLGNAISALDLGIHELGHILFIPFGEFITILGGSLFQCLFPLIWFFICLYRKWYFAACMVLCWIGYNLFDVATYAGDARDRLLPLATFSNDYDKAHDWYQILSRLHHLELDKTIAHALRVAGTASCVIGIGVGLLLILAMVINQVKRFVAGNAKTGTG